MAKILLVEDDNNLREIYEARLKAEGYDIVGASNGEEALVVAKKEQPELVIADVMMPRISGFEMLDILRNTQGLEKVKVIMLTALGQAEDKTRADQLGADRYLVKSQVTLEDIVKAASDLLGGGGEPAAAAPNPAPQQQPAGAGTSTAAAPQQPQPQTPPPTVQANSPAQQTQPTSPQPAFQPVTPPPAEPQAQQAAAPVTPPTPQQSPQEPTAIQNSTDNTSQLNNAVKDLMDGTSGSNAQAAATPQPPTQPSQPVASTMTPPTPKQTDSESVTLSGRRKIEPIGQDGAEKPHINDLLAKEEANPAGQPGSAATAPHQAPASPHPAGQVFSPTAAPQQNPPENPDDPNKIAL